MANTVFAQKTLQIINHYDPSVTNAADYFGHDIPNDQVWLQFASTGGSVSYQIAGGGATTVTDLSAVRLSDVLNGTFTLGSRSGAQVRAGFGMTNPFSNSAPPGIFDNFAYTLAEWTINGSSQDNFDVSYEDTFAFPTAVSVTNGGTGPQSATFTAGTQAADVINRFRATMPTTPTGPSAFEPTQGQSGFGPLVSTGYSGAERWIGSSKNFSTQSNSAMQRGEFIYAPSFNGYLGYLQANEPTRMVNGESITGWYIDYSGEMPGAAAPGYSGYVSITGDAQSGFGIEIHHVRVGTNATAPFYADPSAGDAVTGKVTITPNGASIKFENNGTPDGTTIEGNWTDATIYSGASLLNPDFGAGPVISGTGAFAEGGSFFNEGIASLIATLSASMVTGLLGSDLYTDGLAKQSNPEGLAFFFESLTREDGLTELFDQATFDGNSEEYYDPFFAALSEFTDLEPVYLSPFNDRFSNFSPDINLGSGDAEIIWELGITEVPEPCVSALVGGMAIAVFIGFRRCRTLGRAE